MYNWLKISQVSISEVLMQIVRGNITASQAKMQLSAFDVPTICQEISALWTTHRARSLHELSDLIGCNQQQPPPNGMTNENNQQNQNQNQNQNNQETTI